MNIFNKINIVRIVFGHFNTLKNSNTSKYQLDDILTFLGIPLTIASLLIYFNIKLSNSATSIIITALSILVGLLFNLIVIIFDIIKRDSSKKIKNDLLKELLSNISYSIIISILVIISTLITYSEHKMVMSIASWVVFFFISHFFLTVLMILKRMYALFINEINELESNNPSQ